MLLFLVEKKTILIRMATKTDTIRIKDNVKHISSEDIALSPFNENSHEIFIGSLPEYILEASKEVIRKDYSSWTSGSPVPDLRWLHVDAETVDSVENATPLDKMLISYVAAEALRVGASSEPELLDEEDEDGEYFYLLDEIVSGDFEHLICNDYGILVDKEDWEAVEKGEYVFLQI